MYSKYLNKEVPAEKVERKMNGETVNAYGHDSLVDIIYNEENVHKIFVETVPVSFSSVSHPVFLCTICDKNDRRVQAIGEADKTSLFDDENVNDLAAIAFERAFDNAAIKYLAIEKIVNAKIASPVIEEKINDRKEDEDAYLVVDKEEMPEIKAEVVVEEKEEPIVVNDSSVIVSEEIPDENTEPINEKEPSPVISEEKTEESSESIIITMGKYKGKNMTAKEVYEADKSWVTFILNNFNSKNPDLMKQKEALEKLNK